MPFPPNKLTPEMIQALADGLRKAKTVEGACGLAGIHPTTFRRWYRCGDAELRRLDEDGSDHDDLSLHAVFYLSVEAVKAELESEWTAQARPEFLLTHGIVRDRWIDPGKHITIAGDDDHPLQQTVKQVSVEVKAPWDLLNDPQWAESAKAAYAWLKENDWLLVDDDDDDDEAEGGGVGR